jgi:predicted DNA-binding protein (UPF0251 family)/predicted Fe-Mo cluster-binding NifX family protein
VPRPPCCRRITAAPGATVFLPVRGRPRGLDEIVLPLDEFEAIRLADLEGLYHGQACGRMNVSRQTFGRILESARRKVAEALVTGKSLRIGGGPVARAKEEEAGCRGAGRAITRERSKTMNICIPVTEDLGMKSPVSAHFGSAPLFMIVDIDGNTCRPVANRNLHQGGGMCMPLQSLQGESIDGMVVGGIGMGALQKFLAEGIRVFISDHETVEDAVAAFKAGTLREATPATACTHHGGGHGRGGGGDGGGGGCAH